MHKSLAIAAVMGSLIIAFALVYHGRQLAEVSHRLEAMEQRTSGLGTRLEKLSSELPALVGQAGNEAGRQAVHGVVDELIQMPLNWLRPRQQLVVGNTSTNAARSPTSYSESGLDQGAPWIRFDIREPVVKIEILPNLKEVPAMPWPVDVVKKQTPTTNHVGPQGDVN